MTIFFWVRVGLYAYSTWYVIRSLNRKEDEE